MPRGGARPGAGRKPKIARVLPHPSAPMTTELAPIEEFDAPDDLGMDERRVWLEQAPHAFLNRTLTRATALAFKRYCKTVVLEQNEAKSSGVGGANHRGLLKQVNLLELQFLLAADGRPMAAPPKPAESEQAGGLARFRKVTA